jgi:AAA15 family ATPase/GTPase
LTAGGEYFTIGGYKKEYHSVLLCIHEEISRRRGEMMIVEFRTGNFRSFNRPVTLSMLAAKPVKEFEDSNVITLDRCQLLRCAAVYGANASGKSNLLNAIAIMRWIVINSSKEGQAQETINVNPFRLDVSTEGQASLFEITFLIDGLRYRYGFEADRKSIQREWLFKTQRVKETPLFLRERDGIEVSRPFAEGRGLEERTRDNALFLSVVANFNGKTATKIVEWFQSLRMIHGLYERQYATDSIEMLQNDSRRTEFVEFIRRADLGVIDIILKEKDFDASTSVKFLSDEGRKLFLRDFAQAKKMSISTVHNKYNGTEVIGTALMDFNDDESEGTRKFFRLVGPVLQSLHDGAVVIADELEAKLHPLLTRAIVRLFLSAKTNPNNAQLIFATHDTNLLRHLQLRRDQVWFTEKTQQEATDLYSLAEIRLPKGTKVRKDASFDQDYIRGKYGAVPYLGDLDVLIEEMISGKAGKTD